MNDLIDAILKHDLDGVRKLMRMNVEFASMRSQSGDLPLDIAKSTGSSVVHVSLLRLGAPSDSTETPDYVQLLIDYFAQLSDSRACAGWLSDIEFMLYAALVGDQLSLDDPHGFGELEGQSLDDLRYLLDRAGKWPYWIDDVGDVRGVAISDWESIYRDWQSKNAT